MPRCLLVVVVVLAGILLSACGGSSPVNAVIDPAELPDNLPRAWNMAGGDSTQAGYFNWAGPATGDVSWVQHQSPTLIPILETTEGELICYSDRTIAALSRIGSLLWRYIAPEEIKYRSFSTDTNGLLYFHCGDDQLVCLDSDGLLQSLVQTDEKISLCRFDSDGNAYCLHYGYPTSWIAKYDMVGTELWTTPVTYHVYPEFSVSSDRLTLLIREQELTTYDLDGNVVWTWDLCDTFVFAVCPLGNSSTYVNYETADGDSYCIDLIDPAGDVLWTIDTQSNCQTECISSSFNESYEWYFQQFNKLYSVDLDGNVEQVANNIEFASATRSGCLGLSEDGSVFVTAPDPDEPWISSTSRLIKRIHPSGAISEYKVDASEISSYLVGREPWVYVNTTAPSIQSISMQSDAALEWEYGSTRQPLGITVAENGTSSVFSSNALYSFDASGGGVNHAALPFEPEYDDSIQYWGYWPEPGLHLFSSLQTLYAWDDSEGITWEYAVEDDSYFPSISQCIIGDDHLTVVYGRQLHQVDEHGAGELFYQDPDIGGFQDVAIGREGTIYVSNYVNGISALDANGDILWQLDPTIIGSLVLVPANSELLLVSLWDGLYGISCDGEIEWSYSYGTRRTRTLPAVSPTGLIYCAVGLPPEISPATDEYLTYTDNRLLVIDQDGQLVECLQGIGCVNHQPVTSRQGNTYLLSDAGLLSAVSSSAKLLWQSDLGQYVQSNPEEMLLAPSPTGGLVIAHQECVIGIGLD